MMQQCSKYEGKRTFDIFINGNEKPIVKQVDSDNQCHKRIDSPIKSDFFGHETNHYKKRFKSTQVVIDFINDEIKAYNTLLKALPSVENFLTHKVEKSDACNEYYQFICLLESLIISMLSKLLQLTGLSKLKNDDMSDVMKLNVFQLVYNARLERFDLGNIILDVLFKNGNLEMSFLRYYCKLSFLLNLSDGEMEPLLKLPLEHVMKYSSKFQDLINNSGFTFPSHNLTTCLTKVNILKTKCATISKFQIDKKNFVIQQISDIDKIGFIINKLFNDEIPPVKRYSDYDIKTPDDFKMTGFKTNEPSSSDKQSINRKLPSINKLFSSLPPSHAKIEGSHYLLKASTVSQFNYKYIHLKAFRNSMCMHSANLVKFLQVQIQYCERWQELLEDNDVTIDARYIKSMYSSFHSKLEHQLQYSHESIVSTIQREVLPAIDSGIVACNIFDEKLKKYYRMKGHDHEVDLTKLAIELSRGIPILILQLDRLVELSLVKFHTAYCEWSETIIGNRSLQDYRHLANKEKSGNERHADIYNYYKSIALPIAESKTKT